MGKEKEELRINGRNRKKRISQEKYQEATLFDIPVLFGNERISQATIRGMYVDGADYRYVYGGRFSGQETLESLFEKFNLNHPENYGGHSLSISDVVVIQRNKHAEAYYVDSIGYIRMLDFIRQRKEYVEKLHKRQDLMVNE